MNEFDSLVADTIRYLEQLKASGVERVAISRETLAELSAVPAHSSARAAALDAIWQRARICVKCQELAEKRKHVVFGVGNPEARLVFVGEAPGEDEDMQGEPFVGRAGQLLTKIIQAMGLARHD